MADAIKGITIQIGGDVQPLNKALAEASKSAISYAQKLDEINKKLKLDPRNVELLTQKQSLLNEAIGVSDERLKAFREAYDKALIDLKQGTVAKDEVDALGQALYNAEQENDNLRTSLEQTNTTLETIKGTVPEVTDELEDFDEEIEDTGESLDEMNGMVDVAGTKFKELEGNGYGLVQGLAKIASGTHSITDAIFNLDFTNLSTMVTLFATGAVKIAEYTNSLDPLIVSSQRLNEAVDKSREAWSETQFQTQQTVDTYFVLFQKVSDLNDAILQYQAAGKDTTEMSQQLEFWSGKLNEAVGETVVNFDKETGALKETNKQLTEYFTNLKNRAILEAQSERLKQLYVEQYEEQQKVLEYQEKIDSGAVHLGTSYEYLKHQSEQRLNSINNELAALENSTTELIKTVNQVDDKYYNAGYNAGKQYSSGFKNSGVTAAIKSALSVLNTKVKTTYKSGGVSTHVEFMAQGGIVTKPINAVVGEAGPEAIIPLDRLGDIIQDALADNRPTGGNYTMNVYPQSMSPGEQDRLFRQFDQMFGASTSRRDI